MKRDPHWIHSTIIVLVVAALPHGPGQVFTRRCTALFVTRTDTSWTVQILYRASYRTQASCKAGFNAKYSAHRCLTQQLYAVLDISTATSSAAASFAASFAAASSSAALFWIAAGPADGAPLACPSSRAQRRRRGTTARRRGASSRSAAVGRGSASRRSRTQKHRHQTTENWQTPAGRNRT